MEEVRLEEVLRRIGRRLRTLGDLSVRDVEAFLKLVKVKRGIVRGESIVSAIHSVKHSTILLDGLACMSVRLEDGSRQIYTFHYPGDFVALHRYVFPQSREHIEIEALTNCSIGTIDNEVLEQTIRYHPAVGLVLWRATMIEASLFRERLVTMRRPALQRVAHLLCEQLARRIVLGIDSGVIPLNQIEVADAAGLSIVHTNRIFQDLRKQGVLSRSRHVVEVVNKKRLMELASFDSRYLDLREALAQWTVRLDE